MWGRCSSWATRDSRRAFAASRAFIRVFTSVRHSSVHMCAGYGPGLHGWAALARGTKSHAAPVLRHRRHLVSDQRAVDVRWVGGAYALHLEAAAAGWGQNSGTCTHCTPATCGPRPRAVVFPRRRRSCQETSPCSSRRPAWRVQRKRRRGPQSREFTRRQRYYPGNTMEIQTLVYLTRFHCISWAFSCILFVLPRLCSPDHARHHNKAAPARVRYPCQLLSRQRR